MNDHGTVKEIYFYPVKSLSGIKLDKCTVTRNGIAHPDNTQIRDRKWMIVDKKGYFMTQRQIPKMALIKPYLEDGILKLAAPGVCDIEIPIQPTNKIIICRIWNRKIPGYVCSNQIAEWLSLFLERDNLNIITFKDDLIDAIPDQIPLTTPSCYSKEAMSPNYADASTFTVISDASLNDLNNKLKSPISILNFRPNFYVQDCSGPYSEDDWLDFQMGDAHFTKIRGITRCVLPTVDPMTGIRDVNMEPLQTLKTYRVNPEVHVKPLFGVHIALISNFEENLTVEINDRIVAC